MDNLQYWKNLLCGLDITGSFKPCYKWITFNIIAKISDGRFILSFKPCYKWIIFNIKRKNRHDD